MLIQQRQMSHTKKMIISRKIVDTNPCKDRIFEELVPKLKNKELEMSSDILIDQVLKQFLTSTSQSRISIGRSHAVQVFQ